MGKWVTRVHDMHVYKTKCNKNSFKSWPLNQSISKLTDTHSRGPVQQTWSQWIDLVDQMAPVTTTWTYSIGQVTKQQPKPDQNPQTNWRIAGCRYKNGTWFCGQSCKIPATTKRSTKCPACPKIVQNVINSSPGKATCALRKTEGRSGSNPQKASQNGWPADHKKANTHTYKHA